MILREAFRAGAAVLDLRLVCGDPDDYARSSPIEPSRVGGGKIARAVARLVLSQDSGARESRVYV